MTDRALATIEGEFSVVAPLMNVAQAREKWNEYQALSAALLTADDYQTYKDRGEVKKFKKKSAWRKFGTFYGFKVDITDVRIGHAHDKNNCARMFLPDEKECGCPTQYARIVVRVTAPNGRYSDGIGVCARAEKNRVFTKPDHEIPTTAHTRAVNRAIADLIGVGEDSAEEVRGTVEVTGLPEEDRAAIKGAWTEANPMRREAATMALREWGFQGVNIALLFTDFNRRAGEEQVADLIAILTGKGETFDPEAVE